MKIEISIPDEWTPGQALAMRALLQRAVESGQPLISVLKADVTADQMQDIYGRVGTLIREAGLAA